MSERGIGFVVRECAWASEIEIRKSTWVESSETKKVKKKKRRRVRW